ncbi:ATP-binding cassette domain-containing protein [Vibrio olivae]|uniref:ATP-binding cassette domain-containing protein n=1 Tax=Vibrio olivae TaxID=1243002 RepID=A0ABV5HJF0_9VIBR
MTFQVHQLNIIHSNNQQTLCHNLSFDVSPGQILSLMGPSGCGKSTILSAIAGHLSPEFECKGHIELNGTNLLPLPAEQRKVGILFQDDLLFPHLNVWENLAFAMPNHIKRHQRKHRATQTLKALDLISLAESYPQQISGGQRARVSLLRMLLSEPNLALLDEPFSQLDSDLRTQFRDWVFGQLQQAAIPTVMVTHDQQDIPPSQPLMIWPWEVKNAG